MGGFVGGLIAFVGLLFLMQANAAWGESYAIISFIAGVLLTSIGTSAFILWLRGEFL